MIRNAVVDDKGFKATFNPAIMRYKREMPDGSIRICTVLGIDYKEGGHVRIWLLDPVVGMQDFRVNHGMDNPLAGYKPMSDDNEALLADIKKLQDENLALAARIEAMETIINKARNKG